ncbi:zinc finger protein 91-like [Condylostylus longicornis]|uniref:zinc finger protein 91-like n=1 Tax=Condylostylus longicornis TaxID=2530218 RepID=UPI00244E54D8|nr:zinc finger protein 91-like [Condylostylus longicornis]
MPKKVEESAWSDNDEIEHEENDIKKKRCSFCHKLLGQTEASRHENSCKIAKKCNVSRVLCKSGIKKFVCDICYSTFEFLKSLVEHEKRHIPPGGYYCNYCDERFCTDCDKQKHTESAHKVYKCRLCKNLFETSEKYIQHIKLDHNGKQNEWLPCEKCSRMFSSVKILQRHIDSNCGKNKQFQCDQCHKCFTTKGILKTHMLIHEDRKAFVCPYCGKGFHNKYQLKSHEISHTGEKPWKCNVCFAEFAWKQSLVTHSTLHTGVKPYICECCGSRFSCTSNIIAHRKKRPDTCGLPQYCTKLAKVTPRPSIYNPEMLTADLPIKVKKNLKVVKESDKEKFKIKSTKRAKSVEVNKDEVSKIKKPKKLDISEISNQEALKDKHDDNSLINKSKDEVLVKFDNEESRDDKESVSVGQELHKAVDNNLKIEAENIKVEKESEEIISKNEERISNQREGRVLTSVLNDLFKDEEVHIKDECKNYSSCDENVFSEDETKEDYPSDINDKSLTEYPIDNGRNNDSKNDTFQLIKNPKAINGESLAAKCDNKNKVILKKNSKTVLTEFRRRSERLNGAHLNTVVEPMKKKRGRRKTLKSSRPIPLRKKTDLIKCPYCDSTVYRKYSLKKHLKRIHQKSEEEIFVVLATIEEKGPSLDCDICNKKFTGKLSFEKHYKLHGEDKSLTIPCHDCYGQCFFRSKEELKQHVCNDHNDLKCKECNKTFKLKSSFKEHILRIHKNKPNPPEPTITCTKCGKLVKKCLLRDHERSNCGQDYLYECKICLKKFSTAGILKEHTKIHTGELTAFCKFCNKGFRNKYQCQQHEMVHTGEKPFKCTYAGCTAAFAHRNNMINHFSLHTGLRRYMCSGCTERFSCISSLKAHWRTHADSCALHPENTTKAQFKVSLIKGQVVQC